MLCVSMENCSTPLWVLHYLATILQIKVSNYSPIFLTWQHWGLKLPYSWSPASGAGWFDVNFGEIAMRHQVWATFMPVVWATQKVHWNTWGYHQRHLVCKPGDVLDCHCSPPHPSSKDVCSPSSRNLLNSEPGFPTTHLCFSFLFVEIPPFNDGQLTPSKYPLQHGLAGL